MTKKRKRPFSRLFAHFKNPVTMKELRSRMRGRRAFVVLTIYLFVVSGLISLIYIAAVNSTGRSGSASRDIGRIVFSSVVGVQTFLVLLVGPAFTAGSISGERERQTFDLLRTTLLSANSFVMGKLLSALSYVLLLIFAAIPLQSIAFLLGGISLLELLLSQLILVVAAITMAMFGLYCSAIMRSTMGASVVTFAGILFVTGGIPALAGLFSAIIFPLLLVSSAPVIPEWIFLYMALMLAATNLPATLIVSDMFLLQEGSYFLVPTAASGGGPALMFSPWPLFLLFYLLLAFFLYKLAVRRVRKIAEK